MLWKCLPLWPALWLGMGRNGDTKSGLGPGGAGMFSLVGKKVSFLRLEMPGC